MASGGDASGVVEGPGRIATALCIADQVSLREPQLRN
jgi:hypothetical protein